MKSKVIKKYLPLLLALCLVFALASCEDGNVMLSKDLLVANLTDIAVTHITLYPEDFPTESPIQLLESPLQPGETRAVSVSVPKNQAEKSEWSVECTMENGEQSNVFVFGDFNPNGSGSEISCFGVYRNTDRERYMVTVYLNGNESNDGIYHPDEAKG